VGRRIVCYIKYINRVIGMAAGRLKKGAGTHLASWLQEVSNVAPEEAESWIQEKTPEDMKSNEKVIQILDKLRGLYGRNAGHTGPIIDIAYSGELLATKDEASLRLWRKRDCTLLRVVTACAGDSVAFSPSGGNIVTGTPGSRNIKVWGPAGGSAVGCGNSKITAGKA
jgi:hypothetical protein